MMLTFLNMTRNFPDIQYRIFLSDPETEARLFAPKQPRRKLKTKIELSDSEVWISLFYCVKNVLFMKRLIENGTQAYETR